MKINKYVTVLLSVVAMAATFASCNRDNDITGDLTSEYTLFSGMYASEANINEGGILYILSGGIAHDTTVNKNGYLMPFGGLADGVMVNASGSVFVASGVLRSGLVKSGGVINVSSGGIAISIENGGQVVVFESGIASNTTVDSLADVTVSSGGTAAFTTINAQGDLTVCPGGTASGITVSSGGSITVSSGGTATGEITFEDGANVSIIESAFINFDISQTEPGSDALVNDLSFFTNTQSIDYSITVSETQPNGDYKLAENAADYRAIISVQYPNGLHLGNLYMMGTAIVLHDHRSYTLRWMDTGVLGVTVGDFQLDTTPPTVTSVTPSTTEPDVASVTVTAVFTDDIEVASALYKLGESGEWTAYPEGGVTMTENGTVYFKAVDTSGNESEIAGCTVTNIDNKHVDFIGDLTDEITSSSGMVASNVLVHDTFGVLTVSSGGKVLQTRSNGADGKVAFENSCVNHTLSANTQRKVVFARADKRLCKVNVTVEVFFGKKRFACGHGSKQRNASDKCFFGFILQNAN